MARAMTTGYAAAYRPHHFGASRLEVDDAGVRVVRALHEWRHDWLAVVHFEELRNFVAFQFDDDNGAIIPKAALSSDQLEMLRRWVESRSGGESVVKEKIVRWLNERDFKCPDCAYNCRGVGSASCPECGRAITNEDFAIGADRAEQIAEEVVKTAYERS